jgi:hypothetical protein
VLFCLSSISNISKRKKKVKQWLDENKKKTSNSSLLGVEDSEKVKVNIINALKYLFYTQNGQYQ